MPPLLSSPVGDYSTLTANEQRAQGCACSGNSRFVRCKRSEQNERVLVKKEEAMQQQQTQGKSRPYFSFSPTTITIAQQAMKLFEQSLRRSTSQPEIIAFAEKMQQQVNGKLERMRKPVSMTTITAFDYNEKIVLSTAIQLYIAHLLFASPHSHQEHELAACRQLLAFCGGSCQESMAKP
jgi:hypothetical protein